MNTYLFLFVFFSLCKAQCDQSGPADDTKLFMGALLENGYQKEEPLKHKIGATSDGAEFYVGGSTKIDAYYTWNASTLDSKAYDRLGQWRQRIDLGVLSLVRRNENSNAIFAGKLLFGGTFFWRTIRTKYYAPEEDAAIDQSFINPPVLVALQEGWIKLRFDDLFETFQGTFQTLKLGYFPFLVGRGISLGDSSIGGIPYMGFPRSGAQVVTPKYAPGLCFSGQLGLHLSYDFYYSPLVGENVFRVVQLEKRIAPNAFVSQVATPPSDQSDSRFICAFRSKYTGVLDGGGSYFLEPYVVYYNSSRQTLDTPCDAPMAFATAGLMVEGAFDQYRWNIEVAAQRGKQNVAAVLRLFDDTVSHYHPPYDVVCSGKMVAIDLAYDFVDTPLRVSGTFTYFSGGDYPYHDVVDQYLAGERDFSSVAQAGMVVGEGNKRIFKGFLPLRDYWYRGLWTNPLIMFSAGVIPRPVNFDTSTLALTTHNDSDTATNLVSCGIGFSWLPKGHPKKMKVATNFFAHWEAAPPFKWDVTAPQPRLLSAQLMDAGVKGWYTYEKANSFLGSELNVVMSLQLLDVVNLAIRSGVFFPGQLYADIEGQPNSNRFQSGMYYLDGDNIENYTQGLVSTDLALGRSPAYGFDIRLSYVL